MHQATPHSYLPSLVHTTPPSDFPLLDTTLQYSRNIYPKIPLCSINPPPSAHVSKHLRWSSGHDFRLSLSFDNERGRPGFDSPSESHCDERSSLFFFAWEKGEDR
ncbi:hypothetical protein M3J09_000862 [Ascochyta lentis]